MKKSGFTLLEILVVVVIVGILASLAIPRYQKSVEQAKGAEAIANLNILRGAELRYFGEYGVFDDHGILFPHIDVENPNASANRHFTYDLYYSWPNDGSFMISARRLSGDYFNHYITIDQDGNIIGDWPSGNKNRPRGPLHPIDPKRPGGGGEVIVK